MKVMSEMTLKTNACRMKGIVRRILKNSIALFPGRVADGEALYPPAVAVDKVDDRARHGDGREHRGQDAEAVHDGEAAYRSLAEDEQREAGDQCRDVRVQDRAPGALVAGGDRRLRRRAATQLFAHALVDQDVGVDRHAER